MEYFVNYLTLLDAIRAKSTTRLLHDGVESHSLKFIFWRGEILYFDAPKTKCDTTQKKWVGSDQNGKPILFTRAVSNVPPFLAQDNILCKLASYLEGLNSSSKVALKTCATKENFVSGHLPYYWDWMNDYARFWLSRKVH